MSAFSARVVSVRKRCLFMAKWKMAQYEQYFVDCRFMTFAVFCFTLEKLPPLLLIWSKKGHLSCSAVVLRLFWCNSFPASFSAADGPAFELIWWNWTLVTILSEPVPATRRKLLQFSLSYCFIILDKEQSTSQGCVFSSHWTPASARVCLLVKLPPGTKFLGSFWIRTKYQRTLSFQWCLALGSVSF